MTLLVIIIICSLLLFAYLFDLTSSKTKIPSVILLLLLGWLVRRMTDFFGYNVTPFTTILPIIGTIGLILIVLEGSMELELNKSKITLIRKSFLGALLPMLGLAFVIASLFYQFVPNSYKICLINAIPLCVISSAIAITSVKNQSSFNKEFVIYESSFSDILGVLFFDFVALNASFGIGTFIYSGLDIIIIFIISFIATIGLSLLLSQIKHHIKFIPITILIVLIYAVTKYYNLPALIFIIIFGLFLGNLDKLKRFKWIGTFRTEVLDTEVKKFKELTIELSFLIRSLFFLLFGYLIETSELLNTHTLAWAIVIVLLFYIFRAIQLKLSKLPLNPLIFLTPRGLITILLFFSIIPSQKLSLVNSSLITQIIVLTALIMMVGLMSSKKNNDIKSIT